MCSAVDHEQAKVAKSRSERSVEIGIDVLAWHSAVLSKASVALASQIESALGILGMVSISEPGIYQHSAPDEVRTYPVSHFHDHSRNIGALN